MPDDRMDDRTTRPLWDGRLSLEQQRKRAKELLRGLQSGDEAARERLRAMHPRGEQLQPQQVKLADTQWVVARENGFESWPKLKARAQALSSARSSMADARAALDNPRCLHVRCGSDLQQPLRDAGFTGAFHEFSDPYCIGPLHDGPRHALLDVRSAFIAETFGSAREAVHERLTREYALFEHIEAHDEVVLWFEHDAYDQLILAYLLKELPGTLKARLSLICVERVPGVRTFMGLGQLAPEVIRLMFDQRRPLDAALRELGSRAWQALTRPSPEALYGLASQPTPALPPMGPALLRHLQELPSTRTGLSMTERHTLDLLAESGPLPARALFSKLSHEREAAPFLGDLMYWPILRELSRLGVVDATQDGHAHTAWPKRIVSLTAHGQEVRAGRVDRVALGTDRHVGGIHVLSGKPCWRWDEPSARPVLVAPAAR